MDWLLVGGCLILAWVALCVVSGERLRRVQARELERLTEEALAVDHARQGH